MSKETAFNNFYQSCLEAMGNIPLSVSELSAPTIESILVKKKKPIFISRCSLHAFLQARPELQVCSLAHG